VHKTIRKNHGETAQQEFFKREHRILGGFFPRGFPSAETGLSNNSKQSGSPSRTELWDAEKQLAVVSSTRL
jgi:hypothetical protein